MFVAYLQKSAGLEGSSIVKKKKKFWKWCVNYVKRRDPTSEIIQAGFCNAAHAARVRVSPRVQRSGKTLAEWEAEVTANRETEQSLNGRPGNASSQKYT